MKTLIYIFFFLSFANIGWAQQKDTAFPVINGKTSFGIKAGFTQSDLYGIDKKALSANGQTTPLNGFHVAITANSMIGKYIWLKHELYFTQKGAGLTLSDSLNGNYKSVLKTYYLDLFPVNITFHFKGFQIYAGPYVSVLTDAEIRKKDNAGNFYSDRSIFGGGNNFETKSKFLQKMDFGFNAGIEYEFNFGLNIGVKFVRGFAELIQYANSHTFGDSKLSYDLHNTSLNISLGYSLRAHKTPKK
ncbi:MAG TPA: outer membrane beta-barrel protein [Bacteroidia bacterium]|jgi:hypothetical protein|nr:outer membrane beta-barrel protein [Bacteroidia bacterium]